jgi:hypothetical protein
MAVLGWSTQTPDPAKKKTQSGKSATKSATTVHKKTAGASKATGARKAGAVPRKTSAGGGAGSAGTSAGRTATAKSAAARRSKKGTGPQRATTWRTRQLAPTPERYKEIQSALAAKGYLTPGEATGAWGPASIDALKRFQADQNIEASGKISAMSLIALGLGPKHETAAAKPPDSPGTKALPEQPQ